jgi:hypothetical protein
VKHAADVEFPVVYALYINKVHNSREDQHSLF